MWRIPVDANPYQEQTFELDGVRLRLTLRYCPVPDVWTMDVYDELAQSWRAQGLALVVGVPLMMRRTAGYFFWVSDESGAGLDPVGGGDLGVRCLLYVGFNKELIR